MSPDFVIGSCQAGYCSHPAQTWSLIWREKRRRARELLTALQPTPHRRGTMYFPSQWDTINYMIALLGPVAKADYDSPDKIEGGSPYEQVSRAAALIGLYDIPKDNRFPLVDIPVLRDLARPIPTVGWIFCQGGPAYFAFGRWPPPVEVDGLDRNMSRGGLFSAGFLLYRRTNAVS